MNKNIIEALGNAYLEARRHKRWKTNTLQFSCQKEKNLIILAKDIEKRRYKIKPSLCFVTEEPVKREIFAGDFRDRIIHHLVFDKLNPYYEKLFINDCYSCRKDRGTNYGITRLSKFIRAASNSYQQPAYILKLDISGYFMNIDRRRLYQKNQQLIRRFFKNDPPVINTLLYLTRLIIFNNPTAACRRRGRLSDWDNLPKNKSLFSAPSGKGLPIGNLTSQLFGNVYLNDFDHFVKEKLKCLYYGRYVDDMVFVSTDKDYLKNLIPVIKHYLKTELNLDLHPKKIYLQPISHGVKFLGAFIKPQCLYASKRLKSNFYKSLNAAAAGWEKHPDFINSYLGHLRHFQTYKLRRHLMETPIAIATLQRFRLRNDENYRQVKYDPPARLDDNILQFK